MTAGSPPDAGGSWWRAGPRVWSDRILIASAFTYSAGWGAGSLVVLLGLFFWEWRRGEPVWQRTALDRPIVIFLCVLLISSLWSEWRWKALSGMVHVVVGGFIGLRAVTLAFLRDETFATRMLRVWAVGGGIIGGVAVLTSALGIGVPDGRVHLGIGSNGVGTVLAVAGVLLLGVFAMESGRRKVFACAGVSAGVLGLALTLSRGGWLGAAIGTATLVMLVPWRRLAVCGLVALLVVAAASPLILTRAHATQSTRLGETLDTEGIRSRPAIWRTVPRILAGHVLLGIGFTAFPLAYRRVVPEAVPLDLFPHAHNIFLSFLAETGVAGLGAFIGVLAAAVAAMWRWHTAGHPGSPDRIVSASALAALAALLGHQLVDVTLFGVHIAVALVYFMALGAAGDLRRRSGMVG